MYPHISVSLLLLLLIGGGFCSRHRGDDENDCTPNSCCHPTSCVKADGPNGCDEVACTEIWILGTVTKCEMEGDVCVGFTPGEDGSMIRVDPVDGDNNVENGKCVVDTCCHPTYCLWAEETPGGGCEDTMCTMEYIEGTVSYCKFEGGECVGYDAFNIRLDGGGAKFAPAFGVSFFFWLLSWFGVCCI
jgi:hypothetical protein